jgi:hypothetical protein
METWVEDWPEEIFNMLKHNKKLVVTKKAKRTSGRPSQGLAIVIDCHLKTAFKINFVNSRIVTINFTDSASNKFKIIGAYMPTNSKTEYEQELATIDAIIKDNKARVNIMLVGDLNGDPFRSYQRQLIELNRDELEVVDQLSDVEGSDVIRRPSQSRLNNPRNYVNDRLLINWLEINNHELISCRFTQAPCNTFITSSNNKSLIDHVVLINRRDKKYKVPEISKWPITQVNILTEKDEHRELLFGNQNAWDDRNLSDHRPLEIEIAMSINTSQIVNEAQPKRNPGINWSKSVHRRQYAKELSSTLSESGLISHLNQVDCSEQNETDTVSTLDKIGHEIDKCIEISIDKTLKNLNLGSYSKPFTQSKSWWTDEIAAIVARRKRVRFLWLSTGYDIYRQILAGIRRDFRAARKASEKKVKKTNATKLNKAYTTHRPTYWIKLKGYASKASSVDIDEPELLSHFKNLFSPAPATNQIARENNIKVDALVKSEVQRIKFCSQSRHYVDPYRIAIIMKNLRNNKSPGVKGIKNEYYKYGHNTDLPIIIAKYLQLIINSKAVPTNFNIGKIVPIIKDVRGDLSSLDNIRPITLSDTLATIFELYFLEKLNQRIKLAHEQFGFRSHSSTTHAIFALKTLSNRLKREKRQAYALYIDYSKAFDKVRRNNMLVKLIGLVEENLWLALVNYYSISRAIILVHKTNQTSEMFDTTGGVKQGGNLSPTLFNLVIDELIQLVKASGKLLEIDGIAYVIVYADDTTLICDSIVNMNALISLIERYCAKEGLLLNAKKTQWMKLNETVYEINGKPMIRPPLMGEDFVMNGTVIEKVDRFKFLGAWVLSNCSNKLHVLKRTQAAYAAASNIAKIGFYEENLDSDVKANLLQTFVRPRLMFGSEASLLSKEEEKTLIRVEGSMLKKALGISKCSYSTEVYHAVGLTTLEYAFRKRNVSFVLQLLNNPFTKLILETDKVARNLVLKNFSHAITSSQLLEESAIRKSCLEKRLALKEEAKTLDSSKFTKLVRNRLANRNKEDGVLEFLIHKIHAFRDYASG